MTTRIESRSTTSAGVTVYRAILLEHDALAPRSISHFGSLFSGLGTVLGLANLLEASEQLSRRAEADATFREDDAIVELMKGHNWRVSRMSYHSPMELVLSVTSSLSVVGATLYISGTRVLEFYNRVQRARLGRARTDTFIAAYQAIKAEIETLKDEHQVQLLIAEPRMRHAVFALGQLDKLELVPDDELPNISGSAKP